MDKLTFGFGNKKLPKWVTTFSLPSGYTCPGAKDCLTKACIKTGRIIDGKYAKVRCYSTSEEVVFPMVRKTRWNNFNQLKDLKTNEAAELISQQLPDSHCVRPNTSGDYFKQEYFDAWLKVAENFPKTTFYGYTKSIPFLVNRLDCLPKNFKLTASKGSKYDYLIEEHNLVSAEIVFSKAEAEAKGLQIDTDDSLAMAGNRSFALLIHGVQKQGTKAAEALIRIKRAAKMS